MSITYEQIIAETQSKIEAPGNEVFYADLERYNGSDAVRSFKDNYALELFSVEPEQDGSVLPGERAGPVYEAAKVMFARHPGKPLTFDVSSVYSEFGSPWSAICLSPEEWALHYARRQLETDECCIDHGLADPQDAVELIRKLIEIGVPEAFIKENLDTLLYAEAENDEEDRPMNRYVGAVKALMGWK